MAIPRNLRFRIESRTHVDDDDDDGDDLGPEVFCMHTYIGIRTHTLTYIYIYIYVCVCVCVCV
jgi:hypothetical protein